MYTTIACKHGATPTPAMGAGTIGNVLLAVSNIDLRDLGQVDLLVVSVSYRNSMFQK